MYAIEQMVCAREQWKHRSLKSYRVHLKQTRSHLTSSSNRAAELVDQGSADDVVYIWISSSQLIMSSVTSS